MNKHHQKRGIDEETSSIGMGPVSFDVDMARRHGWKNSEVDSFWEEVDKIYAVYSRRMNRRHPELYARSKLDGTVIYIGPDENGHSLDIRNLDHMEPMPAPKRRIKR